MLLVSLADQYYFDLVGSFQFEISSDCLTIGHLGKPEMTHDTREDAARISPICQHVCNMAVSMRLTVMGVGAAD